MQHGLASGGCVSLLSCEHRAVAGGWDNEESRCRFWWLEVVLFSCWVQAACNHFSQVLFFCLFPGVARWGLLQALSASGGFL